MAMVGTINLFPLLKQASSQGFRWNLAEFPSYKEKPHVAPPVDLHEMMVSRTSEHKEEAVRVIERKASKDDGDSRFSLDDEGNSTEEKDGLHTHTWGTAVVFLFFAKSYPRAVRIGAP